MAGTLLVAAGGGGDAITASALTGQLQTTRPAVIMTYSWDRLMIDPRPGPRAAADFTGLQKLAPHVLQVLSSTALTGPGLSSLPRLADELPVKLLLLDPFGGAAGMAAQIRAAASLFSADALAVVDVGGDALTDGKDPGLRSPLADQLALAACARSGLPSRLVIAAPGIDGEIPAATILARLRVLDARQLPSLTKAQASAIRHVFDWHPSEASGLLTAAACGRRGLVEVRDAGDQVNLTETTTAVFAATAEAVLDITPARHLTASGSLAQAEATIRDTTGISEISYETNKALRLRDQPVHHPTHSDLSVADRHAHEASARGAQYISMRRLAELLHASTLGAFSELCELLATERPHHYEPSIYRTQP